MKFKSQKGSVTVFVLIALLFYTAFLLLMYAANTNKLVATKEKSDILKGIYEKNTSEESINNIYNKKNTEQLIAGIEKISLPAEYQQVAYLESTGTQYIDTGVIANNVSKAEFQFSMTENNATIQGIMGGGWSSNNKTYQLIRNGTNINLRYGETILSILYDNAVHRIELSKYKLKIDEIEKSNTSEVNDNRSVYLFARRSDNFGNGVQQYSYCRIYYCKIYNGSEVLQRDFIPCYRKADNKPGLYDTVNDVFYTNQGTGDDFIVAPDID